MATFTAELDIYNCSTDYYIANKSHAFITGRCARMKSSVAFIDADIWPPSKKLDYIRFLCSYYIHSHHFCTFECVGCICFTLFFFYYRNKRSFSRGEESESVVYSDWLFLEHLVVVIGIYSVFYVYVSNRYIVAVWDKQQNPYDSLCRLGSAKLTDVCLPAHT